MNPFLPFFFWFIILTDLSFFFSSLGVLVLTRRDQDPSHAINPI